MDCRPSEKTNYIQVEVDDIRMGSECPSKTWIDVTSATEDTYTSSSNLRSFRWEPSDEEYEHGKLIVRFQTTGVYTYDAPKGAFDEMCKRAYNPDEYQLSAFQWYDENLINYVDKTKHADHLYEDKYSLDN